MSTLVTCLNCGGVGRDATEARCPVCSGKGKVRADLNGILRNRRRRRETTH